MKYYIVVSSAGDTKVVVLPANWDNGSLNVCLSRLKTDAQGEFRGGMKIFTEINQDEYRKVTGDSYLSSNYASHPNFFRGDILPEDWREQAMAVLTSGGWIDQLGWEDDLAKLVAEQIDSAPNVRIPFWNWRHTTGGYMERLWQPKEKRPNNQFQRKNNPSSPSWSIASTRCGNAIPLP